MTAQGGASKTAGEPVVVPLEVEFMVPCPFCEEYATHKGTCRLSQMNTGFVYVTVAKRIGLSFEGRGKS